MTVNYARYSISSYSINDVVNENTDIYKINRLPNFFNQIIFVLHRRLSAVDREPV